MPASKAAYGRRSVLSAAMTLGAKGGDIPSASSGHVSPIYDFIGTPLDRL